MGNGQRILAVMNEIDSTVRGSGTHELIATIQGSMLRGSGDLIFQLTDASQRDSRICPTQQMFPDAAKESVGNLNSHELRSNLDRAR